MDFLQYFIQKLIGLDYWLDKGNNGSRSLSEATSEDMIFKFLYADSVQKVFRALIAVFVILLIVFTIYQIIKSEWDYMAGDGSKGNSKASIFRNALKAIALVIVFPVLLVMGIVSSNAILASIINAVGVDTASTFGGKLFAISASSANKYRYYADTDTYIPISDTVVFYTNDNGKLILFGNGSNANAVYYSEYREYLMAIYGATKHELTSIMDPLVPSKETSFKGFCFKAQNIEGDYKYYFIKTEGSEKDSVYKYLTLVLGAQILSDKADWANEDEIGKALKSDKKLNFTDDGYISSVDLGECDEITRSVCRNSWNYSLIYMNPSVSLSQSVASVGGQYLKDYDLADEDSTSTGAILYNSSAISGYFDGGQFGIVQSKAEYQVMADVVDYMCDNNLTFYIMDATSSQINWNYSYTKKAGGTEYYTVDNKWISNKLTAKIEANGSSKDFFNALAGGAWTTIKDKTNITKSVSDKMLTFLTSYSNSNTLSAEHEQDIIYTAKFNVGDESQGSRYIICLKDGNSFYPLVNGKDVEIDGTTYNFKSDHYASDYTGVVWAKGTFDTSTLIGRVGNPTYLKNTSTSTMEDASVVSDLDGKYYYELSEDKKTINVYGYNTRLIKQDVYAAKMAYNEGNLYLASPEGVTQNYTAKLVESDEGDYLELGKVFDDKYKFVSNYKLKKSGEKIVDGSDYYQYTSAEKGFSFVFYSADGKTFYYSKNADGGKGLTIDKLKYVTCDAGGASTTAEDVKICYLDGANSRIASDLVLEKIEISDPQFGSTISNSLKTTFSFFDGEEYVGAFTKMSPKALSTTNEGDDTVFNSSKYFETKTGDKYYNITTMGTFTDDKNLASVDRDVTVDDNPKLQYVRNSAAGRFISFFETTQETDSVTCYRYNIDDYSKSSFGSVLIEWNFHLFKGIHDFKFGIVQEVSDTPEASVTFLNAGANEGITFDYFFDQNVKLQSFYSASKINYVVLLISSILIIKVLFTSLWGVIKRFYMITLYYLAMPVAASTMPIDDGARFGEVRKKIVGEVLSTYGVLIGLNVFFVLLAPIESISKTIFTEEAIANSGSYFLKKLPISAKMLNEFIYVLFLLVAFTLIGELPAFVQGTLVKEGTDLAKSGTDVKSKVKTTMSDAKAGLSGESLKKSFKETKAMVPGLIPGSALLSAGAKKVGGGIKTLSDSFGKGKQEADGGGDGEKKSNGRDDYEYDDNYDGRSNARDDDESEENGYSGGGSGGGGSSGGGGRSNARDDGEVNPLDDEPTDNEQMLENSQNGTTENIDSEENINKKADETSEEGNLEGRSSKPLTEDDVRRIIQEELEGKRGNKGDKGETGKDGKKDNIKIGDDLSDSKVLRQVLKDRAKAGGDGKFITDKAGNKYTVDKKGSIIDENGKRVKGDKLRELKKDLLKNGVTSEEKKKALGKLKKKKAIQNIATKALIGGLAVAVGASAVATGGVGLGLLMGGGTALAGALGVGGASKIYKTVNRYRRADDATRAQMIRKMGSQALTVVGAGALTLATGGAGGLALAAMAGTSGVLVARNARRVRRGDHSRAYGAYGELSGEGGSTVASSANNAVNNSKKKSKSGVFTKRNDAMVADVARSAIKSGVADKVLKKNGNSLMVKGKKLENVSFDKKGNIYSNGKKLTGKELRDARVALNNQIRKTDKKGYDEAVGKAKKKQAKTALIRKSAKVAALAGFAALTGPVGLAVGVAGMGAIAGVEKIGKLGVGAVRNFRDLDPEKKKALLKKWGGTALKVGAIGAGTVLTGGVGLALGGAAGAALGVGALGATGFLTKRAVNAVKAYRGADDETKAKMIRHYGNRFVAVAGAGLLTLATGGAAGLALGAAGATGGAIVARDEIKVRRYNAPIYSAEGRIRREIRRERAREEINNTIDTKIERELDYRKRISNQSVKVTEKYINEIVDKRVAELIRNAKETGVLLDGREKIIVSRSVVNNEAIDDKRFVSNIPEAYRNVLVNSAATKAARVIAGDVIENMAVENGATVHKEVVDHISDDRKLEIYKSVMTEDQLETLKMRFAKERTDSTEMVKFIERSNLHDGLGLSLQASVDAKKGLMFSVNNKQVVDKAVLRDAIKEILASDGISTDRVINSMQNKGYTTNVEAALAANYATSVNYSTETTGNVSSEYHQNVFAEAMKDATIRSEAILEYLNKNESLMNQFLEKYSYKTVDGEYLGDVSDQSLLTTIQNKMDTDEFFTKMSVEDYSKELSETIGRHIQDGSFKVEAFDLLSKEEQSAASDRIVANIAEMSNGGEYAFTTEERTKVGEFSAVAFDDSSLVSTFASSQDEMKEEIINSVIAKYFGLSKEDGSIDVSSKESVKLLKEMESDSEFKEKIVSGSVPKEELLVEFAKTKLQKQVSASNEVVGNVNDKKPIENMVIGKNAELVELLNGYKNIDLLSTEDVQRIAKARNEYNLLFNELRTAFGYVEGGKKEVNTRAEARAKAYISAGGDITKVAKTTDSEKDSQVLAGVHQILEERGLGQEYLQKLNTGLAEYHTIGADKFENIERLRMSGETKDGLLQKIETKGYTVDAVTGNIIKKGIGSVENLTQTQAATGKVIGNINDKTYIGTTVIPYTVKDERARELLAAYADLNDTRYSSEDIDKLSELYRSFDELQGRLRFAFGYQEDKTTVGNINNESFVDENFAQIVDAKAFADLNVYKKFGSLTDKDVVRISNAETDYTDVLEELKKVFGYSVLGDKETNKLAENMARDFIAQGGKINDIIKANASQVNLTKFDEIKSNWSETELAKLEKGHQEFETVGNDRMLELMNLKRDGVTKAGIIENLERKGVTIDELTGNVQFDKNYKANQLIEGAAYDYLLNGGKIEGLVPEQVKIDQDKVAEIMKNVDTGKLNAFSEIGADESKRKFVERRTELQKTGVDTKSIIEELKSKGFDVDSKNGDIIKLGEKQSQETAGQGSRTTGYVSDAQLLEAMIDNSSSREESTKNLAEILRNVLSTEQISSLQKAGSENGFIALSIQQQNELLAKLATADKGAMRVLERNSVDTQNSESIINFLNSKLGANLRERLISNMDLSLYEAKELLAGKTEAEIHGSIQGEVEKSKYAEQVQRTQGELISTEKIQTQMVENADDYAKLVEMAVGKFKLISESELESASPEQKIKLAQDLLANGGLERFRSVAEFVLNDTALKNSATGLLKSKTGEDLDSLNMIDKYNFLFNHYKEIAKEGTDERAELERLAMQKIEFNNQFGNKTVLEKLKPEEIEVLIKDMGRDGKSLVAKAGQEHIKQILESEKIDIVPDTKMMSKEESLRFRENLATLQQAYTKGEGEEMFVSLFKNATLVNQNDIIREIVSGGRVLTNAEFAKERAKILESNPEFIEKVDRLTAKDVIERKEFNSSLEKVKKYLSEKENTNFDLLTEQEKIGNITRIFNDEKLRRKAGIVGTEFADFEKLASKINAQEIKTSSDYDVKQSFTNEQIMAYLRAHENTRQKLIEIGASQSNYMFAKNKYEKALRNFAINNSVMRQATMIQYANQAYSSSEIRQLIRNEITNSNSSMYRKETQKLTDKEINDYINKHLEELKALFAEDKLLDKNSDGSFELKNPKEQNFEFDRSMMNAMRNAAIKNLVDDAVSNAVSQKLGRKAETKKEYDALIKELADKIKDDERVQKVIDEKVKVSVPDAFRKFLDGQEASVLITDTIDKVSADPRVADIVISNHNAAILARKRKAEAELRRKQADLLKAKK